jgi:hypothetical protein
MAVHPRWIDVEDSDSSRWHMEACSHVLSLLRARGQQTWWTQLMTANLGSADVMEALFISTYRPRRCALH